jgi:hypothetical protein
MNELIRMHLSFCRSTTIQEQEREIRVLVTKTFAQNPYFVQMSKNQFYPLLLLSSHVG